MRIPDSLVEKLLVKSGRFKDGQIAGLREQELNDKKPLQDLVIQSELLSEDELTRLYAEEIEVPFIDINPAEIDHNTLGLLPERVARQYKVIVFTKDKDNTLSVAMEDPGNMQTLHYLHKRLGTNLKVHIITSSLLDSALNQYRGNIVNGPALVAGNKTGIDNFGEITESDSDQDKVSSTAQTVNILLEKAAGLGASDMHIEPREDFISIRYRVDGVLREAGKLPHKILPALTKRIKQLANLDQDEHHTPQDGRFKLEISGTTYTLRVSTMPVVGGEEIVIRIRDEAGKAPSLSELGLWGKALRDLNHATVQPNGLILIAGPSGSGKSTTLFSILSSLNTPSVNISTIEDPIDYRIIGINQTQVDESTSLSYVNGLRALLRQEPNIIMVGDVHDSETADLVVQAASTGHLVFSGLHLGSAAACLARLKDMGVEPFLIASTLRIVVAQRLVRRLCSSCRVEISPNDVVVQHIKLDFGLSSDESLINLHSLEQAAAKEYGSGGLKSANINSNDLSTSETNINRLWKASPDGCPECNHSGYKGRIGVYEVMPITDSIGSMIASNSSAHEIDKVFAQEKGVSLKIDGLVKALRGLASVEEVLAI